MSEGKGGLSKVFDVLGKIVAIVVLIAMAFKTIVGLGWLNAVPADIMQTIATVVNYVLTYGALVLAGIIALEFGTKHGIILTVIILVLLALVVIPQFFPEVWAKFNSYITVK
ncbi:MAG: hypothetical protein RR291_00995 [Clostridia bacterium]